MAMKKEFSLNALFNVIWKGDSLWSASGRNFQGIPLMHSLMQLENELFVLIDHYLLAFSLS